MTVSKDCSVLWASIGLVLIAVITSMAVKWVMLPDSKAPLVVHAVALAAANVQCAANGGIRYIEPKDLRTFTIVCRNGAHFFETDASDSSFPSPPKAEKGPKLAEEKQP